MTAQINRIGVWPFIILALLIAPFGYSRVHYVLTNRDILKRGTVMAPVKSGNLTIILYNQASSVPDLVVDCLLGGSYRRLFHGNVEAGTTGVQTLKFEIPSEFETANGKAWIEVHDLKSRAFTRASMDFFETGRDHVLITFGDHERGFNPWIAIETADKPWGFLVSIHVTRGPNAQGNSIYVAFDHPR